MNRLCFVMAAVGALLLPAAASAQTVDSIELGTHVWGEKWQPEDLKGRTVGVYFWDVT